MTEPKTRISKRVKAAIDLMVFDGQKRDAAADNVGLHRDSLRKAFKRPDVLSYLREQEEVLRTSARARTIAHAERLMESAESEHVQLGAIEYLNPPVQRSDNVIHHHGLAPPGLTIIYTAHEPRPLTELNPAETTIEMERRKLIASLPKPLPHPSDIKREGDQKPVPHPATVKRDSGS